MVQHSERGEYGLDYQTRQQYIFIYLLCHAYKKLQSRYAAPANSGADKWLSRQSHKLKIAGSNPASATN